MAVLVLVAGGCGAPEYHYVKNTEDQTFVRVPQQWTLFDEDELLRNSELSPELKDRIKELTWQVGFDAAPDPNPAHVWSATRHPWGLVQVRELQPEERDRFSLSNLRAVLLDFDPLAEESQAEGGVEVVASRDIEQSGLHGNELLINLRLRDGELVKWRQVALIDSRLRKVHVLAISCDSICYNANEKVIDQVVASWKVQER